MNILLSTHNPTKTEQIKALFAGTPIIVKSLADAGIADEATEDGATLEENASKKARFARARSEDILWAMADDSGIFIDALGGLPGVNSSRWVGASASTDDITLHTLKALEAHADRAATFRTVVAVIEPDGREHFFTGKVRGRILEKPRVRHQPKMPYSSIFVPEGTDLVWAEMSVEKENEISHRGKAFRLAREFLLAKL